MPALRLALAILAGLSCTSALLAAEVRGRIASVDLAKKQLRLDGLIVPRSGPVALTLDERTEVVFGKKAGTLADLPVGRRVRVFYEERNGSALARTIHVPGRPPRKPAPATGAAGQKVTGVLRRVAYTEREVVLVGPGAKGPQTETVVAVPDKVRVMRDGKAIKFDDLREGERASVEVQKRDGRWVATAIQIGAPAPVARDWVPAVRRALWVADKVLQQMERAQKEAPPP